MALSLTRCQRICSLISLFGGTVNLALSNLTMDADTERLGYKYFPATTSPITDIDVYVTPTGTVTDSNFILRVETDSSDTPSGTLLGTATPEFAGPSAGGYIGLKTLATNTGNLTLNVPVWITMLWSSGGSLSGTEYIRWAHIYGRNEVNQERVRHYNGTNWTTTSVTSYPILFVIKHLDGTYVGLPITSAIVSPTNAIDIFGTNRQGIRMKFGSQVILRGIQIYLAKVGTPNNLVASVYEGSTLKYSGTIPQANVVNGIISPIFFTSPVLLTANTNIYVILSQESDGGTDSADYDNRIYDIQSPYIGAILPPDMRYVYGTGNDPTTYTVETTEVPMMALIIDDPAVDLDEAGGGGGGLLTHPGMSGGMRG